MATLARMKTLALSASRNSLFRIELLRTLPPIENLDDLDHFLRSRFRYRPEVEEILREPEWMLNDLSVLGYFEGDCDDIETLSAAVLAVLCVEVRFVAIRYSPDVNYLEHVFLEARAVNDRGMAVWQPVDVTVPVGTRYAQLERLEYGVN